MGRRYALIFLWVVCMAPGSFAQVMDCEQTIAYAAEEFNAGHFYSVPAILEPCMKDFTRDQRQRAFLLLTQTYLLLDDPIGAKQSFLNVLEANPEFVADERIHPIDVVYLSKRFTATPRFSWFVNAGTNITPVRVIYDMKPMGSTSQDYLFRPGYNVGAGGEFSFHDHFRVRLEGSFFQSAYRHVSQGHFRFGDEPASGDQQSVIERQTWVNAPLYLVYSDNKGRYRPYGYAGISLSYMLSDRATITNTNIKFERIPTPGEAPLPPTESFEMPSPDFDFLHARRRFGQSVILGAGLKHKIGLDFVFVDARYSFGLRNVVDPRFAVGNSKYDPASPEFVESATAAFQYGYMSDYFRLDNISLTIGFVKPLYKARELKRARTRGVLRKVKRTK